MMRINLLPENERASLHVVQLSTLLIIAGIVMLASLSFATVYLRWQVVSERERQASYQSTMSTMARYRTETSKMQQETKRLRELVGPLEEQLKISKPTVDVALLFNRTVASAQTGNVWLRELSIQKDGSTPISGYAVEFNEVSRFLNTLGQSPLSVIMGSTRWAERGGVKLLEFTAKVSHVKGVAQK